MQRKLAAIMIADVAAYVRLSQTDEEGTRARFLADLHEVFEPRIAEHHGRLIKTMGDGVLAEFGSVVDALRCAVEIERAEAERNAGIPADRRLEFRIGINLGDVIVEGDDIHGDGVNIAHRLQGLAEPGGVTISGAAYEQVKNKVDVGFAYLGERPVKNIPEPVRVYRVLLSPDDAGKTITTTKTGAPAWRSSALAAGVLLLLVAVGTAVWLRPWEPRFEPNLPLPDKPSIAVLPFANMSGDAQQEYFADGLTDDLITDLARISGLFVSSRNATFTFKGRNADPREIAKELGVQYVLEGSVQRAADQVRINVQLIDAVSGGHEWAERYDGSLSDVFALQDKIIQRIVAALELRLLPSEAEQQAERETEVPAAYDAFLRGFEIQRRDTPADLAEAVPYLEKAVALDPNYGRAHAVLASIYWRASGFPEWEKALGLSGQEVLAKAKAHLQEAMKHPSPPAYRVAGDMQLYSRKFDEAVANMERAIALDPSDSRTHTMMALALIEAGRPADGESYIKTAMRLDPTATTGWVSGVLARAQFGMDRFEEAAASLQAVVAENPDAPYPLFLLIATYGYLGRTADAGSLIDKLAKQLAPDAPTGIWAAANFPFKQEADTKRLLDGLRRAGMPELPFGYDAKSKDRLTGDEIGSTIFGHTIRGRNAKTGGEFAATFATDGSADYFSADGGRGTGEVSSVQGSRICYWWSNTGAECASLFHNPAGARERQDEFVWVSAGNEIYFSVVE